MRVLVVDDDESIRYILRRIIENRGNEVVGEAANGQQAVELSERLRPDLVLLDISMPIMSGFRAARSLHGTLPGLTFMFVSEHREQSYLDAALACGAKGFVVKSAAVTELPAALRALEAGEVFQSALIDRESLPT